jgi:hypothetical protein
MPLLTELEIFFRLDFYKDVAPDGAGPISARCTASRNRRRCEFFWTNFFDGRKVKIVKQKNTRPSSQLRCQKRRARIEKAWADYQKLDISAFPTTMASRDSAAIAEARASMSQPLKHLRDEIHNA